MFEKTGSTISFVQTLLALLQPLRGQLDKVKVLMLLYFPSFEGRITSMVGLQTAQKKLSIVNRPKI